VAAFPLCPQALQEEDITKETGNCLRGSDKSSAKPGTTATNLTLNCPVGRKKHPQEPEKETCDSRPRNHETRTGHLRDRAFGGVLWFFPFASPRDPKAGSNWARSV
jgi:hypothetical protein